MTFNITVHLMDDETASSVLEKLQSLITQGIELMKTLEDLKDSVAKLRTADASLIQLVNDLAAMIRALPPNAQAISDLADEVEADAANIAAAVAANTELDDTTSTTPAP